MIKKVNYMMLGFVCVMLFSCSNKKKEYLTRDWVVNSIELDDVNYGKSIMRLNLLHIEDNNTGSIPWVTALDEVSAAKGTKTDIKWRLIRPNDDGYHIEIYDSKIDYFNDTFEVVTIDKDNYLVQFVGKRVKLDCQGVGNMGVGF